MAGGSAFGLKGAGGGVGAGGKSILTFPRHVASWVSWALRVGKRATRHLRQRSCGSWTGGIRGEAEGVRREEPRRVGRQHPMWYAGLQEGRQDLGLRF